jgi:putative exosortase-associated protein (TIGR04073 family)
MTRALTTALALLLLASTAGAVARGDNTATDKFLRGLAGVTTGVLEVPGNMAVETKERGPAAGLPLGFVQGLGMLVMRELVGVYEIVSSPFPVPADYEPVMRPEYPWGYFRTRSVQPELAPRTSRR